MPSVFSLPTFWTWCLLFWRGLFHCLFLQQNSLCLNWECPLCCFILFLFLLLCKVRWSHSVVSAQSCPTLCNPVDCKLLGFSVHGILQARILEWIAVFFSRGSSRPRDWTRVSLIGGRRFNLWATREVHSVSLGERIIYHRLRELCVLVFLHSLCGFNNFFGLRLFLVWMLAVSFLSLCWALSPW